MAFVDAAFNPTVQKSLGLPANLATLLGEDPTSCRMVVNHDLKAALILQAPHWSVVPDRTYTLFIDGKMLRVAGRAEGGRDDRISVYVSPETDHFTDGQLVSLVREALSALHGAGAQSVSVKIKGRPPPALSPRDPEQIIQSLNRYVAELFAEEVEEIVLDLFVPVLVRPAEVDPLLVHGRRTSWRGLSPAARSLFEGKLRALGVDRKA